MATSESETVEELSHLDTAALKGLRAIAKRKHTKLVNVINQHIVEEGRRTKLKALREELIGLLKDCKQIHALYMTKLGVTTLQDELKENEWMVEVDKTHNDCQQEVEQYILSRQGTASTITSVSGKSEDSEKSKASRAETVKSQLSETIRQKIEAEEQLKLLNMEKEKRLKDIQRLKEIEMEEVRRLRDLEKEKVKVRFEREQRQLESKVHLKELVESLIRKELKSVEETLSSKESSVECSEEESFPDVDAALRRLKEPKREASTRPAKTKGNLVDDWIDQPVGERKGSGKPTVTPWLMTMLPKVEIKPFSGNPKDWPMFISSFKSLVKDVVQSDAQKLAILKELLAPRVRDVISGSLQHPALYPQALQELKRRYGDPRLIKKSVLSDLMKVPAPKDDDTKSLEKFGAVLRFTVTALKAAGQTAELESNLTVQHLEDKLPKRLRQRWARHVQRMKPKSPTLLDLDEYIDEMVQTDMMIRPVDSWNEKVKGQKQSQPAKSKSTVLSVQKNQMSESSDAIESSSQVQRCWFCKKTGHRVSNCDSFSKQSVKERFSWAKAESVCFRCLQGKHQSKMCKSQQRCGVGNCSGNHHRLLHADYQARSEEVRSNNEEENPTVLRVGTEHNKVLLAVVPVKISYKGRRVWTNAVLDTGSEVTLVSSELATQLDLNGPEETIRLETVHAKNPRIKVHRVSFQLSSKDDEFTFDVNDALVVPRLNVARRSWNSTDLDRFEYLKDVELTPISKEIGILIGMDVVDAHVRLDEVKPRQGGKGPVAIKTPFGWCLVGKISGGPSKSSTGCYFLQADSNQVDLETLVEKFWTVESLGVMVKEPPMKNDDKKAIECIEGTIRYTGKRYEVGLPWKDPEVYLPDNKVQAGERLKSVEKRFTKDPVYAERYKSVMNEYLATGQARKVDEGTNEARKRTWYLPHHGVISKFKPGKVRIVFDASAKFKGVSLNDVLLKGPDLATNLIGVLLRFREKSVPVSADIVKMFHQVEVREEDRGALRFLWREDLNKEVAVHEMCVQIFGSISSPTICTYVLRKTAKDHADDPEIEERVTSRFYVDNYLDSFHTEEEALTTCQKVSQVLQKGGFQLSQWLSASRCIMREIAYTKEERSRLDLDLDKLPTEKTLGIWWDCERDIFRFETVVKAEKRSITKRELLSVVAKLFDPLGLVSPVIITAKVMLQKTWRLELDWDETLPEELESEFFKWLDECSGLEKLRIPRVLIPCLNQVRKLEVHVFCDASGEAYGTICYLRVVHAKGVIITPIMAKTRVAPKKTVTIPRLELMAAVVGLRLGKTVVKELTSQIDVIIFWTDSEIVLHWIHSTTRRSLVEDHPWFRGPSFLKKDEKGWPVQKITVSDEQNNDLEVVTKWSGHTTRQSQSWIDVLLQRVSSWNRIQRIVAWILRFYSNTRKPVGSRVLSQYLLVDEIEEAAKRCILTVQRQVFDEEMDAIEKGSRLSSQSRLLKLTPMLSEGVLRVGGRLDRSELSFEGKHPIILPSDHALTKSIIRDVHHRNFHPSAERTFFEVRRKYWPLRGRRTVKSVVGKCQLCKRFRGKPVAPMMSPLPRQRLQAFSPPFTNTGIDYFGPLTVVLHRRPQKRYGCLFTCLTTRAVHIEMAHSLDEDSFLMSFKRFTCRRGTPAHCYSDNGTNLTSGEKEIQEILRRWNQGKIADSLSSGQIQWHFSPPSAPHFGGVWERLVQSAKTALKAILRNRSITDEVLSTALVEVEYLLNSRPLTHVSVDPVDLRPLTPNHFLLGRANPSIPPDAVTEDDVIPRKRWKTAQVIAEHFWRRWMKEYLPNLIERRKWLQPRRNVKAGDIVLLADTSAPRGTWPIGRILEAYPGVDGTVRTVKLRTAAGIYNRPVTKLCLLETEDQVPQDETTKKFPQTAGTGGGCSG